MTFWNSLQVHKSQKTKLFFKLDTYCLSKQRTIAFKKKSHTIFLYNLIWVCWILFFQAWSGGGGGGGGDFLMSSIRVCATDQGRFFTSKNPEQAPNFEILLQNRPYFLKFYCRTGSFFDNLVSNAPAQMSKIPVAFLKVTGPIPIFFLKSMPIF